MTRQESTLPKLAIWLLLHVRPGTGNEALAGDIVERFREGRSLGWLWKQVFIAIVIGFLVEIGQHWPQLSYAVAGYVMMLVAPVKAIYGVQQMVNWWALPFPLSMLLFNLSPTAWFALTVLPVLAVALLVSGAFRWISLLRTWLFSVLLITVLPFMVFPLLPLHPVGTGQRLLLPTGPYLGFFALLVSAWLGCRTTRRLTHSHPASLA